MKEFKLKAFTVHVPGHGSAHYYTTSRGKALADAWRSDAFAHVTFKDFLKIARVHNAVPPDRFGEPIKVCGEDAFYVRDTGHYVEFCRPGADHCLYSHPLDVDYLK